MCNCQNRKTKTNLRVCKTLEYIAHRKLLERRCQPKKAKTKIKTKQWSKNNNGL